MTSRLLKQTAAVASSIATLALSAQVAFANSYVGTVAPPSKGFADNLGELISGVLSFVMVIAALLLLMYMIWGGIEWVTSGGDKGKTEGARNKITSAVIGMIILAAAFAVTNMVVYFLGFNDLADALTGTKRITGDASSGYSQPATGPR